MKEAVGIAQAVGARAGQGRVQMFPRCEPCPTLRRFRERDLSFFGLASAASFGEPAWCDVVSDEGGAIREEGGEERQPGEFAPFCALAEGASSVDFRPSSPNPA